MDEMFILMFVIIVGIKHGNLHAIPVSSKLQVGTAYLPPLPESTLDENNLLQVKMTTPIKNSNSYTTSYKTNHNSQNTFETIPQMKSESSYSRTYHNSYAPQPSGIGKKYFLPPTPAPLPSLIPHNVLKQLSSTSSTTFPSSPSSVSFIKSSILDSALSDNQDNISSSVFPSIIMVDNSMEVLTPSQNQTIFAARLLASSLLKETAGSSPANVDGFNNVKPSDVMKLNSKDMFIVKAQKNAYIVPSDSNTMEIQQVYSMRNKLDKAYTINQFIFIVRPEHINFLNKLV